MVAASGASGTGTGTVPARPARPADRLFAVWDRFGQLLPSKSLRLRVWVSLMGSLPPPPLTFLFTVSNTQSTS